MNVITKFASRTVHVDIENRELLEQMVVEIEKKVQQVYDNRFADTPEKDDGDEQHIEDTPVRIFEMSPSATSSIMTPQKRLFSMLKASPPS